MSPLAHSGVTTTAAHSRLHHPATTPSGDHDSRREGVVAGIIAATCIWAWIAIVDAFAGHPFQTFSVLGGVVVFTTVHYLLNIIYGMVVVSAVDGAAREPSLALAAAFGLVMFEIGIAMLTVLLSHVGLGELAWVRIFGGSLIGMTTALVVLARRYPIAARLRDADVRRHAA